MVIHTSIHWWYHCIFSIVQKPSPTSWLCAQNDSECKYNAVPSWMPYWLPITYPTGTMYFKTRNLNAPRENWHCQCDETACKSQGSPNVLRIHELFCKLHYILHKDAKWEWNVIHQESYELCKLTLKSAPILGYPKDRLGYRLYTNASDFGIRAILQQIQSIKIKDLWGTQLYNQLETAHKSGNPPPQLVAITNKDKIRPIIHHWDDKFEETEVFIERVIAYWSRLLKSAKRTTHHQKGGSHTQVKFQPLSEGKRITAITDHSALTWSRTYNNINWRLMSWGLTYSVYPNLKIIHRARWVHSNVDPLSWPLQQTPFYNQPASNNPDINLSQEKDINFYGWMKWKFKTRVSTLFANLNNPTYKQINIDLPNEHFLHSISYNMTAKIETHIHVNPENIQTIIWEYQDDPHFSKIHSNFPKELPFQYKVYHQNPDGLILFNDPSRRDQLCIPASMKQCLMEEIHGSLTGTAHRGFEWTYRQISNGCYWPRMTRDIRNFCATCLICQKIKHARHAPYGLLQIPIPNQPFKVITMDFIGELPKSNGFDTIFVLSCKSTNTLFSFHVTLLLWKRKQHVYSLTRLSCTLDFQNRSSPIKLEESILERNMQINGNYTSPYHCPSSSSGWTDRNP